MVYFTNHGELVAEATGSVGCTDPKVYATDCVTNRGFIFIGWNGVAKNGEKVGTGAYIARLSYFIKVAGQSVEPRSMAKILGIVRQH
jgi:hypothetical protein